MSGWKEWAIGEVVEAADFQSFIQDQVVQVYADSGARGSALGTAVTEGMVSYLSDTNSTEVYDGSSWTAISGGGAISEVAAGTALTGGGTAGTVTLNVNQAALYTNGTSGYTVLSNGTAGLAYQAVSPNYIINGAFDIWQRGTSFTPTAAAFTYTADRWDSGRALNTTGATVSRQASGLTGFEYSLRYQRTAASSDTSALYLVHRFESPMSIPLAGQTVTLSFYAKKGANYSASSDALNLFAYSGTGTNQGGFPSTWTGTSTLVNNQAFTLTTSWQRFQVSYAVGSTATQLGFLWQFSPTGTAGADDWYEITGVQLEAGSVATPFKRNANSLQGELAACQRYYVRFGGSSIFEYFGNAIGESSTLANAIVQFPVQMRTAPASIDYATLRISSQTGNDVSLTNVTLTSTATGNKVARMVLTAAANITTSRPYFFGTDNSTSAYLGFSAEL